MDSASAPVPPCEALAAATYTELLLNLRGHFTPFTLPSTEEVILAITELFPYDSEIIVLPLRGRGMGHYRVCLSQAVADPKECVAKFGRGDGIISVPLAEYSPRSPMGAGGDNRRKGTLVTFVEAGIGPNKSIGNEDFDEAMAQYGEVVKPTMLQFHKNSRMLNGNRYCVVDTGDKVVPGTVVVCHAATHRKVPIHTRYRGQTWWCRRCRVEHVGACEALKAFYAARDLRAAQQINMKVVADSTLRRAEQVGLCADVLCMSGGGIGHLANAIRDDPVMRERGEVCVVTALNDVRAPYQDDNEFVFAVEKGLQKLSAEMASHDEKHLVVQSLRPQALDPVQELRAEFLTRALGALRSESVTVAPLLLPAEEVDKSGHPTEAGTAVLLGQINDQCRDEVIVAPDFITSSRLYAGVQSVFLYGCRTCDQLGEFLTPLGVCPGCEAQVLGFDGAAKWSAFLDTVTHDPPPAPAIDPANWRDAGGGGGVVEKRPRETDSGSDEDKMQKVHVTEVQRDIHIETDSLDGH